MEAKNIVLTGFMGCGKTTVGQLLAKRLNREFLDADLEIERRQGMPVTEIFKTQGEPAFRQMEKDLILDLCRHSRGKIISLGGGAFMQEEIRNACLASSDVFFLDLGWESWVTRHHLLMETRPILQSRSIDETRRLFESRHPVYALSHHTIRTDDTSPEEIAEQIIRMANDA
ncbi:shikimate kinase [Cohnella candidum]|uniref:Shikimate kinase n=1 Tax=Cohnella candidum TaxID=2674991 RepID=A0A3G3JZL2_9BACL|nr:shikimate kinase [Cohnella candidum]AYQ73690.1 shikimate kinase [Cohnella candidum]